jgi:flavin-dependent dehydrogenase
MIIGAGIVGSYLGKLIGDCEIWEQNSQLREKPCSALLSKTGLNALKVDFKSSVLNEVQGAVFHSSREEFTVKGKETKAYVLDRLRLQETLSEDATDAGCKIIYGKKWSNETDDYVIGADGALSAVAKSCDIRPDYVHTYQIEADTKTSSNLVHLYFDSYAPGFFAWSIPIDEKTARFGIGCKNGNPKENFEMFLKEQNIKIQNMRKAQSALIPIFDPAQKTVFGNKALVGDAAGQVKATTGGGIIFGCKCAEELARAINQNNLAAYENMWRSKYEKDLKMHLRIRQFLDKVDYDTFFRSIKENNAQELISEHGDMEHTKGLMKELLKKPKLWRYLPKFLFV